MFELVHKMATDNYDWMDILLPWFERSIPHTAVLKRTISVVSRGKYTCKL